MLNTWEMIKEITENPNKRFKSLITGEVVELEFTSIRIVSSKLNCMLDIEDQWGGNLSYNIKAKRQQYKMILLIYLLILK